MGGGFVPAGVALLSKISQLMSNPENQQFVSFLTLAEGWDMREVAFDLPSTVTGISDRDSDNLRGTFARRVNSVPAPGDVWSDSGRNLWTIYREVVNPGGVILAKAPQSDADAARVQAARALIGPPDTPQYQAYTTCRDQYRTLEHSLRQAELTLANTPDPTERAKAEADRNQYSQQLNDITQEWIARGYKAEIEDALQTISGAYANDPVNRWIFWQTEFSLVTSQTDSSGAFWPTGYRPDRLFDAGIGWIKFSLSGSEAASLAASAPPEVLRTQDALGDAVRAGGEIQQMSMEVARVDVERTWFHPELFSSRSWQWSIPDQQPLSDGAQPSPQGTLPGYVIGLVLVRNISITWKTPASSTTDTNNFRVLGNLALQRADLSQVAQAKFVRPIPAEVIHLVAMATISTAMFASPRPEAIAKPVLRPEALHLLATSPAVSAKLAASGVKLQPSIPPVIIATPIKPSPVPPPGVPTPTPSGGTTSSHSTGDAVYL